MTTKLVIRPIELDDANAFVRRHHRTHKPVVNHRFSIACYSGSQLVGVAIVGRPISKAYDKLKNIEVLRVCTDGTKNACSKLYGAAARIAQEIGYEFIRTYTAEHESGVSLKASGWTEEGRTRGGQWDHKDEPPVLFGGPNRSTETPSGPKRRWVRELRRAS
jgi:hypothetical protein